jgi:putative transposase
MRRTSQLVGLDFSTGRSISPLPVMASVAKAGLIFMTFRERRRTRRWAERNASPHLRVRCAPLASLGNWIAIENKRAYGAAKRTIMLDVTHNTQQYGQQSRELSHQPTRMRERQMRRFKSPRQAQRFLSVHSLVQNLFRVGRHLLKSIDHRLL